MSDQSHHTTRLPQMLTQQPPATTLREQPIPLPILEVEPNETFLTYDPVTAGRAVVVELYPPKFVNKNDLERLVKKHGDDEAELGRRMGIFRAGTQPQAAWQRFATRVNFAELGIAAQKLERAGVNWRQAIEFKEILDAADELEPEDSAN